MLQSILSAYHSYDPGVLDFSPVQPNAGKSTITIFINLHSIESYNPPKLEFTDLMASHRVISEANRIGVCAFGRNHTTADEIAYLRQIRKIYTHHKRKAMRGNTEFFKKTNRQHVFTNLHQHSEELHNVDQDTFLRWLQGEYTQRLIHNSPTDASRIYTADKVWGTRNDATEHENYIMGVHIIAFHHTDKSMVQKIRDLYYNQTYSWSSMPPDTHGIPDDFFSKFKPLQSTNLMNLEVSQKLSDLPFGYNESSEITGIPRYSRTSLSHLLLYFKNVGFDYVNMIDSGCRSIGDLDYTKDEDVKEAYPLMRTRSAEEKRLFQEHSAAVGLLKRKRRLTIKHHKHKIHKYTRQRPFHKY